VLQDALAALDPTRIHVERAPLDPADAERPLARHLGRVLATALRAVPGEPAERLAHQVALVTRLLARLRDELPDATWLDGEIPTAEELHAVAIRTLADDAPKPLRPGVPLSTSALLVNARDEHRIGHELKRELASADAVDLVCAFVRWQGLRLLEKELRAHCAAGRPLRVLTTVYCGSTEARALDALVDWGAEVKVSYDTQRTRLHAKAWLFRRDSGFSTAYIGSSNLSVSALLDGLEWNVRLSAVENAHVLDQFAAAFEAYWQDPEFEPYTHAERPRFEKAIRRQTTDPVEPLVGLDVEPYPFQREILAKLEAERTLHGRWRNLVVAATGTGKTVVAALDYRRVRRELPRLLFVAHRKEILKQSRSVFRTVLKDGSFGELWVDGERPAYIHSRGGQQVFASIQTLARADLGRIPPDAFDAVIVDEVHHAEAPTYERLLSHLRPRLLLGLTATPERADGKSILDWFDGRIAAELRLWTALERQLLAPFQYFGVHDDVDLSSVRWTRGGYDATDLENVYVFSREAARRRVALIVEALRRKVDDPRTMRALGFCVGVAHARFMAEQFSEIGIPAVPVLGTTDREARDRALRDLRDGRVNAVFTVDLFNEGVDVPNVDTLLFLRPTESPTIFLQQLGRGLRRAEGKTCCTVLDFIARPHRQFRFDLRWKALVGGSRRQLERQIEDGFPVLPAGCAIDLDREAARVVLANLRDTLGVGIGRMVEALRECAAALGRPPSLAEFVDHAGLGLDELYRKVSGRWLGWTRLRREAGLLDAAEEPDEPALAAAVARLLHLDDTDRPSLYRAILDAPDTGGHDPRRVAMLHFALWGRDGKSFGVGDGLARLGRNPHVLDELRQLLALLDDRTDHLTFPLELDVPLRVHASYTLAEILTALGRNVPGAKHFQLQAGVLWDEPTRSDLFFVTTEKSARDYSPTTMYRDYAISPELFHWESQSTTAEDSTTGRRYRQHRALGTNVLLFVRKRNADDRGVAAPYVCLGLADYVRHAGERPMAITWALRRPMPAALFGETRLAAA
jgi:superfamily II DNA or RNA helicase/HKD family nuclease